MVVAPAGQVDAGEHDREAMSQPRREGEEEGGRGGSGGSVWAINLNYTIITQQELTERYVASQIKLTVKYTI